MPSPASPVLRALRRLVARDPEAVVSLGIRSALVSLKTPARSALRPIEGSIRELLCGYRPASAPEAAGDGTASAPEAAIRLNGPLARARRHRRFIPLSACLVLVAIAAVSAMPPVSAAGAPPTASQADPVAAATDSAASSGALASPDGAPSPDSAASPDAAAQSVDQPPANSPVDAGDGDGTVYNVIQPVEIAPGSSGFQIYVVRGGDGLNKIGQRFGLKGTTIYWANAARLPDPSSMSIGLKLVIPPVDGVTVTVKGSNTLSGFGSKYKVSVQAIMAANGLTGATLTAGQLLIIPTASVPAIPLPKVAGGGGGGGTSWTGTRLRWPVPSSRDITQYFSSRHGAIDIGAPTGSPVIAAVRGTVIFAGWKRSGSAGYGGGLVVWVSSGGKLYTTYNHLSAEFVRVGQVVSAGQRIGSVGMTGNATGPHLHFEVWVCYPWSTGTTSCARNPMRYF